MNRINSISQELCLKTSHSFSRFLIDDISSQHRVNGIIGSRGVGKTTLLLQCMKKQLDDGRNGLYVSMDDFYFSSHSLKEFASDFYRRGGTHLYIDDLYKKSNARTELLSVLNDNPDLKVIYTSAGNEDSEYNWGDFKSEIILHKLPGMSFREYLAYQYQLYFPIIKFDDLLELNRNPGSGVLNRIRPLQYFDEYLHVGYYTFSRTSMPDYQQQVIRMLNHILELDFFSLHHIDQPSLIKIRQLIWSLVINGPVKPNIERLAESCSTTRDSLLKFLKFLNQADIVSWLTKGEDSLNYQNKPARLSINNSNLISAISLGEIPRESLIESFFVNQLQLGHKVTLGLEGRWLVDDEFEFILEEGKKNSINKMGVNDAYYICDGIDHQTGTKIPLWMMGFLY